VAVNKYIKVGPLVFLL